MVYNFELIYVAVISLVASFAITVSLYISEHRGAGYRAQRFPGPHCTALIQFTRQCNGRPSGVKVRKMFTNFKQIITK